MAEPTFEELMKDARDPIIPFGKHRGKYASDIPAEYLDWLIGQEWLKPELEQEIFQHLRARAAWHRLWHRL